MYLRKDKRAKKGEPTDDQVPWPTIAQGSRLLDGLSACYEAPSSSFSLLLLRASPVTARARPRATLCPLGLLFPCLPPGHAAECGMDGRRVAELKALPPFLLGTHLKPGRAHRPLADACAC